MTAPTALTTSAAASKNARLAAGQLEDAAQGNHLGWVGGEYGKGQVAGPVGQARDLLKLALALAIDFVEGFKLAKKPRPKRGPKGPNWKGADGEALVSEVQALVAHNQISINKAIQMIIELAPERYGDYPPEDLKNRYYEARKRHTNRRQNAL